MKDIELLRQLRFPWTKIAKILGMSRATLYRRLDEDGVEKDTIFTAISDGKLDQVLLSIKENHPTDGEVMMMDHLTSRGVHVSRARLRASIHRIDHDNTIARRSVCVC